MSRKKKRERKHAERLARIAGTANGLPAKNGVSLQEQAARYLDNRCPKCANKLFWKEDTKEQDWCPSCKYVWPKEETLRILREGQQAGVV